MEALYVLIGLVVIAVTVFGLWLIGYICLYLIGGKNWAKNDSLFTVLAGIMTTVFLSALIGISYILGMELMVFLTK